MTNLEFKLDGWLDFLFSAETMKYFYNIKPVKVIKVQCQNPKSSFLPNPLSSGRVEHILFAGPKLPEVFKIWYIVPDLQCLLYISPIGVCRGETGGRSTRGGLATAKHVTYP